MKKRPELFPSKIGVAEGPNRTIDQVVRNHIVDVMVQTKGNRTHAARILGITRRSLYRKLEEYASAGCERCGGMTDANQSHAYNCPY